jgi:hypothetical protein
MLTNKFNMKDLGIINVILGIKITMTYNVLVLFQSHYVEKVLNRFFKCNNNTSKTPMDISVYQSKII